MREFERDARYISVEFRADLTFYRRSRDPPDKLTKIVSEKLLSEF